MDEREGALIEIGDLAGLSDPAKKLVEVVADYVGVKYEPKNIVKTAKANRRAARIAAKSKIEIDKLMARAQVRLDKEILKEQSNIEDLVQRAIPHLVDEGRPEEIEEDWLARFFSEAKLVSDEDVQMIWSRILAGEANSPGSTSKRTLDVVRNLTKQEAVQFTKLCGFCCSLDSGDKRPLIFEQNELIPSRFGLDFDCLSHIRDIGLIEYSPLGFGRSYEHAGKLVVTYFDIKFVIEIPEDNLRLDLGLVRFTQEGRELDRFAGADKSHDAYEYIHNGFEKTGWKITRC